MEVEDPGYCVGLIAGAIAHQGRRVGEALHYRVQKACVPQVGEPSADLREESGFIRKFEVKYYAASEF